MKTQIEIDWQTGPPPQSGLYWLCFTHHGFDKVCSLAHIASSGRALLFGKTHYEDLQITHHAKAEFPTPPV